MKVWSSKAHQDHNTASRKQDPGNMECPERVSIILGELQSRGMAECLVPRNFDLEPIVRVHDARYVDFLEGAYGLWQSAGYGGEALALRSRDAGVAAVPEGLDARIAHYTLTAETAIGAATCHAARVSANLALSGIAALTEGDACGFALCRPPGHHATSDQLGGFCYLNNVVIAAYHALELGIDRVAVLDIDYHHGNGGEAILAAEPRIFFASLHADTRFAYPFMLGRAGSIGVGAGEGTMRNFPMPAYTGDDVWREALRQALGRIHDYGPELLLVSLGVDTYIGDPISDFRLESDNYLHYGGMIARLGKPTLFVMEGGYNLDAIGVNVANVLEGYLCA